MSVSSFQPLNPRQLDLQRRLLIANELRETSLIEQLELQWVHRYGVNSLPKRTADPSPDALPSAQISDLDPPVPSLSLVSESTVEEEPRVLHVAPLANNANVDEIGSIEDLADRSSKPPLDVAPPPLAGGAHRFRRWMVASSAMQDLRAS